MASDRKENGHQATAVGKKFHVAGDARKGAKAWQEDSFMFYRSANSRVIITAVFDGHGGYNGLLASATAKSVSETYFEKNKEECETWAADVWVKNLEALFEKFHESIREKFVNDNSTEALSRAGGRRYVDEKGIVRSANGDPIHGGSTATMAVLINPGEPSATIICANVGDSAAIVVQANGKYEFLTTDHGPENRDEFVRVQSLSATDHPEKLLYVYDKANVFRKYECPKVFLDDGTKDPLFVQNPWGNGLHPTNVRYEPAVYAVTPRCVSRDTTCIAMTRALGDFYAHQFGLTYKPSISVAKAPSTSPYMVAVASDGIWDCWKYEDFAEYLIAKTKEGNIEAVVDRTLNESIQRAITNFGVKHYDDASLVCIWGPVD